MVEELLKQALMNPPNSYSPEQVKLILDSHSESLRLSGFCFMSILFLWLLLAVSVVLLHLNLRKRVKKLEAQKS